MTRSVRLFSLTALAAGALVLSACAPGDNPLPAGSPDPDGTLNVALILEPTNLDIRHTSGAALEQVLIDNVYQGLVRRTEDGGIGPSLASAWTVSDDGLAYTFTLEDGVTFADGTAMTAEDVVASLQQATSDATIVGSESLASVAAVASSDPTTVTVTLKAPDQSLLFALTGPAGLVLKQGDTTDLATAANGTGPFSVAEWKQGDSLTFDRRDDYWGDPAGVAEVVFSYIPDFTAAVNAGLDGSVDVVTAVDAELAPQLTDAGFTVTAGKTTDKFTLAFNNTAAPLDDQRVREALRLAINHDALVETVQSAVAQYGPIPALDPGYEDLADVAPYDPDRARTLLADAGQQNLTLTLTVPSFYGDTVPTFLVSAFNDIGVTLKVQSVEFATWLDQVYTKGDYQLSMVNHVEPRDFINWTDPTYYFHYDNPEVAKLYAEAMSSLDEEQTDTLLAQAARIVSEDDAADWLYTGETLVALLPGVHDFPQNSINSRLPLAQVTVSR